MNNPHEAWDLAMEAFKRDHSTLLITVLETIESAAKRGKFSCALSLPDPQVLEGLQQYLLEQGFDMDPEPNSQVRINWRGKVR